MKELNINDGWESVVNDPDRQERIDRFHAKRKEEKLNKLSAKAIIYLLLMTVFGILGCTGALVYWLSVLVALPCMGLACFNFGRYSQLKGW